MLKSNFVNIGLFAEDYIDAIRVVATPLIESGYVAPEYLDAVLLREKTSPTGLPVGELCVAIPHADPDFVNMSAASVGLFSKPVLFGEMGSIDNQIPVDLVMVLAIKNIEEVVPFLQKACNMFQDEVFMASLRGCTDSISIFSMLSEKIKDT